MHAVYGGFLLMVPFTTSKKKLKTVQFCRRDQLKTRQFPATLQSTTGKPKQSMSNRHNQGHNLEKKTEKNKHGSTTPGGTNYKRSVGFFKISQEQSWLPCCWHWIPNDQFWWKFTDLLPETKQQQKTKQNKKLPLAISAQIQFCTFPSSEEWSLLLLTNLMEFRLLTEKLDAYTVAVSL